MPFVADEMTITSMISMSSQNILLPKSVIVDKQGRTLVDPVANEHITQVVGYNFQGEFAVALDF